MMRHRQPAVVLLEMLVVLFVITLGGTLITMGVYAVMRNQRAVGTLQNRYAVTHSILHHLRADVRAGSSVTVAHTVGEQRPQLSEAFSGWASGGQGRLAIKSPTGDIVYVFHEDRVDRILGMATHGMFRPKEPMLSSIRFADTWLNLYDIYGLTLNAELVVLSTCESGTADVTDGDEILGLTRGFLYAGARALLASQWRVSDATTAEFMKIFYRRLKESNDAATALKAAMAEIRAERPHPYYWAPFFLTGRPARTPSRIELETTTCAS